MLFQLIQSYFEDVHHVHRLSILMDHQEALRGLADFTRVSLPINLYHRRLPAYPLVLGTWSHDNRSGTWSTFLGLLQVRSMKIPAPVQLLFLRLVYSRAGLR
jgi:hypothetical protein